MLCVNFWPLVFVRGVQWLGEARDQTHRLEYPLTTEYALNYSRIPYMT